MSELTWTELVEQVGKWSQENFGDQESKVRPLTSLHELAPLLGLVEEVAYEYNQAGRNMHKEGKLDALADAVIFLADFWYRSEGDPAAFHPPYRQYRTFGDLLLHTGRLCHLVLKAHQGIRYRPEQLQEKLTEAVQELLVDLDGLARAHGEEGVLPLVERVWRQVSKRNWRKDAISGGESKHGCGKSSCGCSGSQSRPSSSC